MAIEESVLLKLEKLSKLRLSEEERSEVRVDLDKILSMINKLDEVDTKGIKPLIYIHEESNVLRADATNDMIDTEEGLKNAPKRIGNYFAVPKIINKKT